MGTLRNFVTPLHKATARDVLARMIDDKVGCMLKAKEYEYDYWDGSRRFGYGGYNYLPGRWKPVAEALIATACGLAIAIMGLLPYNYLNARSEQAKQDVSDVSHALEILIKKSENGSVHR